jgi:hypothetical protein
MSKGISNLEPLYEGARIKHNYLERQQEIIAVNRSDLEDILTFDGMETTLSSIGLFLLSGALWLGIDKALGMETFTITPILAVCTCSIIGGTILLVVGLMMGRKKRDKIARIFKETRSIA